MDPSPEISWITKLTLLLVSSLTILSIITISPALPLLADSFRDVENSEFLVKLILTIPALSIAIVAPIAGRLIDKRGRLGLLWGAMLTYALAGSAGFYLTDLYAILVSRIVLGIAVGITMTIVVTLVADYFEGQARQRFVGIQVAFMSLAGILFIGLGGVLADLGWRFPFLLYLLSLLVLPLAWFFLQEPGSVAARSAAPPVIRAPKFIWVLFFHTMLMWILFFLIPVQIPFLLQSIGVASNALIGVAIATSTTFSAFASFSFSALKNRYSFSTILGVGYLLMSVAFFTIYRSETYGMVTVALAIAGAGVGLMIPSTNTWVMNLAPVAIRGKEMGKLTTFWFLGQFLSPLIIAPVLAMTSLRGTFGIAGLALLFLSIGFFLLGWSIVRRAAAENPVA